MPKKVITIIALIMFISCFIKFCNTNVKSEEKAEEVTLYSVDGRQIEVEKHEVIDYLKVWWYIEPMQQLYGENNECIIVTQAAAQDYCNTGYWSTQPKPPEPQIPEEDILLLARVIYAEATENASLRIQDRQYVGRVVVNRINSGYWGNSLSNVVYARGQYACVGNSKFKSYPPQECLDIAKQCLAGEKFGMPDNVIFQAQFRQGSGIWKKVGVHYYCYR